MNKKIIFFSVCILFIQSYFTTVFAVKASPFPITIKQPDGSQLTIRIHGDEYYHYYTTEDGYLVKMNHKGQFNYANINSKGEIVGSNVEAKQIHKRSLQDIEFLKTAPTADEVPSPVSLSPIKRMKTKQSVAKNNIQKVYPRTGSGKSLVILVNFSDVSFSSTTPQQDFTNMLNQPGYSANASTGSACDYFMASSYGKFTPNFVVVGPYNLPKTAAYYGTNIRSNDLDSLPEQMVVDACNLAKNNWVDFTQFDTDNDGYVDNVFVYYAGNNEAEGATSTTIWPHKSTLLDETTIIDGKKIYNYSCSSELRNASGTTMCGIGTFCHEFGHVLGLPDYYHSTNSSKITLDKWDIMDAGSYLNEGRTPPTYSSYSRFYLGYSTPQQIATTAEIVLDPLYQGTIIPDNTINQSYILSANQHNFIGNNPNPKEFFIVEYRKKTGWDSYLPKDGVLIWHIDYDKAAWDSNGPNNYTGASQNADSHMRVYLQPLTGNTTTPGTAFTTGSFTPLTWSGVDINRSMSNIRPIDNYYSFSFMAPKITTSNSFIPFSTTVNTPTDIQTMTINAANLTENLLVDFTNKVHFEMKLSTESTWKKSMLIAPTANPEIYSLQIRYNPEFNGSHTEQLKISNLNTSDVSINLSGNSTLPKNPATILVGKIDNNLQFPSTQSNSTITKTINIKTTEINSPLNVVISGSDASYFTVSMSLVEKDTANSRSGQNITVSYRPLAIGTHLATMTISGGGLPDKVIQLQGVGK